MSVLLYVYASGALLALYFYKKWYEYTISYNEISVLWFYHLPKMVIERHEKIKLQKAQNAKFAEYWSQELFKAYKISKEEGWNDCDWKRWNEQMEYTKQFII